MTTTTEEGEEGGGRASSTVPRSACDRLLWTLNLLASALHGAWVIIFVLLWALDKRPDGSRRDITYPLYVSYATWGDRPPPPLLALSTTTQGAAAATLEAGPTDTFADILTTATRAAGMGLFSPYPSCVPPETLRVAGMDVTPAWQDSGLVLSLHWLVVSFFALSFLFQAAAAVLDVVIARRMKRARSGNSNRRSRYLFFGSTTNRPGDEELLNNNNNSVSHLASSGVASWLRFVEYSFSAAVMIVAIGLQVGIMDAWMLFVLAALTWVMIIIITFF